MDDSNQNDSAAEDQEKIKNLLEQNLTLGFLTKGLDGAAGVDGPPGGFTIAPPPGPEGDEEG